jgi:hypothetical protein
MSGKLSSFYLKLKPLLRILFIYVVILSMIVASFFVGMYHTTKNTEPKKHEINRISKDDVVLAIDENNNLIIIEKNTGDYTIYEDTIGKYIFNLYANNVWFQNTQKN